MLDGVRRDSTVGCVEIERDMEFDGYEVVIFFTSHCTECGWKGKSRDNEECPSSEARRAMEDEAREHMRISHSSAQTPS